MKRGFERGLMFRLDREVMERMATTAVGEE